MNGEGGMVRTVRDEWRGIIGRNERQEMNV